MSQSILPTTGTAVGGLFLFNQYLGIILLAFVTAIIIGRKLKKQKDNI